MEKLLYDPHPYKSSEYDKIKKYIYEKFEHNNKYHYYYLMKAELYGIDDSLKIGKTYKIPKGYNAKLVDYIDGYYIFRMKENYTQTITKEDIELAMKNLSKMMDEWKQSDNDKDQNKYKLFSMLFGGWFIKND